MQLDVRLASLLGEDPVPWILASDEPFAHWAALTGVFGRVESDPLVVRARCAVLDEPRVRALVAELPRWGEEDVPGHHSPKFLPNRLNLLADMGVRGADDERVDALLELMLEHQDRDGRFLSWGRYPGRPKPQWGSLACDTNAIADVMLRFGRGGDPRVAKALSRMQADMSSTPQGLGWRCIPETHSLFRGPGRKADACPQVTLEALRAFSQIPEPARPKRLLEAARAPLAMWRRRTEERPYMFGHGYQFKTVKWPDFWYSVLWVLETVGRYPGLWRGEGAREEDRRSVAELAACLVAYNFAEDGRVIPRRAYRGFEEFSFGQKRDPSPFATARCLVVLARVADLADEIRSVEVEALPSSKGGMGKPVPPPRRWPFPRPQASACPAPRRLPAVRMPDAIARVLARHHIGTPWAPASVESLTADIVGLHATDALTPYLSLHARLPGFSAGQLDRALYDRRSLVRFRCMRGTVFIVRREMLPVVHAATTEQVVGYARRFAESHGVTPAVFGSLSPRILEELSHGPASTRVLRARLDGEGVLPPGVDLAAAVTLMAAEGLLLQERPRGGRGREPVYEPLPAVLPDVRLGSVRRPDADVRLVREYVRAFGPVTPREVIWWTGIGRKRTRRALETLGDEVTEVDLRDAPAAPGGVAGDTLQPALDDVWLVHTADLDDIGAAAATESPLVALLPALDPLLMGYVRRGRFVAEEHRDRVFDRSGNVTSTILVDGRVAGVWDSRESPEPAVLVHLFPGGGGTDVASLTMQRAEEAGRYLFGEAVRVERVEAMTPLPARPAGAFRKPLRGAAP